MGSSIINNVHMFYNEHNIVSKRHPVPFRIKGQGIICNFLIYNLLILDKSNVSSS